MPWYPEAIVKPVERFNLGGNRAVIRKKGRGVANHTAASVGASLYGYFSQPGNPCSHFYVRWSGIVEQYVDTDYRAPANLEGNSTIISIETQGGANEATADTELWYDDQVESLIRLHYWLYKIDNFPLQMMPNSKPESRGIGYHRLGINPWRVPDGELWSDSRGKICPGHGKIVQIVTRILPGVIQLATPGNEDWLMAVGDEILAELKEISKLLRTEAVRSDNVTNKQFPDLRADTELISKRLDYLANNFGPDVKDNVKNFSTQMNTVVTKLQEVIDVVNQRMPQN